MPATDGPAHRTRRAAGMAACVVALLAGPAAAQQATLRGAVQEDAVQRELRGPTTGGTARAPAATPETVPVPYRPASRGAVADEDEGGTGAAADGSLFPSPGAGVDDPFAGDASEPYRPRLARKRREDEARARDAEARRPGAAPARETPGREAGPVDDGATGAVRQGRLDALDEEANRRAETVAERAGAIEGRDPDPDDDPYAPVGLRLGSFDANASFEQGLTWSSNADFSPGGSDALLSETTLRFGARSDWPAHFAGIDAYGTFRRSLSGERISEGEGGVDANLRLDLADGWSANAHLGYAARPETGSSPVVIEDTLSKPLRHAISADAGVTRQAGKLRLGIGGEIERLVYGDARLSGGGTLSQEERNSTLALARLRAGYEVSPALVPFVEAEIGRRRYDVKVDSSGYERSANRLALRAGAEIDLGEKFSGEVSAGWVSEDIDDARLARLSGLALDAALRWSPMRGTTVALDASTEVEGTTTAGESGSIRYSADLSVERRLRANLTATLAAGAAWRDYAGSPDHELTLSARAEATWWFNRHAGLTGRLRHERFDSTLPGRDYDATSIFLGLRLQR